MARRDSARVFIMVRIHSMPQGGFGILKVQIKDHFLTIIDTKRAYVLPKHLTYVKRVALR